MRLEKTAVIFVDDFGEVGEDENSETGVTHKEKLKWQVV